MFIKLDTLDYPLDEVNVRSHFPNVSFPAEFVAPDGFASVEETDKPEFNPITQFLTEGRPLLVSGVWKQTWTVVEIYPSQSQRDQAIWLASVPQELDAATIRQAMSALEWRSEFEGAVAASDQDTKDWWEFSASHQRRGAKLVAVAGQIGKSSADLDELFTAGDAL